jgi:hypothetical protein
VTTLRSKGINVCLALVVAFAIGSITVAPPASPEPESDVVVDVDSATPAPEAVRSRIYAKSRLVDELAAGRLSLIYAAALFRELDRLPPEMRYPSAPDPDPPLRVSSPTDGERHCRTVIVYARNRLRTTAPGRAEAVIRRLVAEFWAERDQQGTINLPAVTPSELQELLERARNDSARGRVAASGKAP